MLDNGVNVTEPDDTPGVELLKTHGQKYLEDLFPGTSTPILMAELMSTLNPDIYLNSQIVVDGFSMACSLRENATKKDIAPCTQDGSIHDSTIDYCYVGLDSAQKKSAANTACSSLFMSVLHVESNDQLASLSQILKQDVLLEEKTDKFWTDVTKNVQELVLQSGRVLTNETFDLLNVIDSNLDKKKSCFSIQFQPAKNSFIGQDVACGALAKVICSSVSNNVDGSCRKEKNENDSPTISKLLDPQKKQVIQQRLKIESDTVKDLFHLIDMKPAFKSFFELLWYAQLPCFDTTRMSAYPYEKAMIKQCIFQGNSYPCHQLFETYPTDKGLCCTFNMQKANEVFRETDWARSVINLQNRDHQAAFNFDPSEEIMRNPIPQEGVANGLTIMLDAHTDILKESTVGEDFYGFYAMVDSSNSYPVIDQKGFRIRPGHENFVAMSAVDIQISENFKDSLDVSERRCYFAHEYELKSYKNYTQASCLLECKIQSTVNKMLRSSDDQGCIPWYLPNPFKRYTTCGPWQASVFNEIFKLMPTGNCSQCLPDCSGTKYSTSITAVPFRQCDNKNLGISSLCNIQSEDIARPGIFGAQTWLEYGNPEQLPAYAGYIKTSTRTLTKDSSGEIFSKLYAKDSIINYDAYEKDIAVVHFYFDRPDVFQYSRQPSMTWVQFWSQVGGLLGLCIGFSICSGVELIYWLGIRIWWSPRRSNKSQN